MILTHISGACGARVSRARVAPTDKLFQASRGIHSSKSVQEQGSPVAWIR